MNQTSPSHWLTPDKVEIEIENLEKNKAVIVNIQQTGYYRVNYDNENWNLIISALQDGTNSINRINRGQIFNDLFNLAKTGHVSYNLALDSTKYLFSETDYIPWKAGLISLGKKL